MSFTFIDHNSVSSCAVPKLPAAALSHIPGTEGWPFVGNTFRLLADPKGAVEEFAKKYGLVYRNHVLGQRQIVLLGPDANEFVLLDQAKIFSAKHGWKPLIERLFPGSLLLLDFEEHRLNRKALSVAFKTGPMQSYLANLNFGIKRGLSRWMETSSHLHFYPAIKQLTFELAAVSFLGKDLGPDAAGIKSALINMLAATVSPIRHALPCSQMQRGVRGREYIVDYFSRETARRRGSDGEDIFTQLCKATHDNGALLPVQEIVDHISLLMMAAHDTLTSSLTSFMYFLTAYPEWQEKLREEAQALGLGKGEPLPYERLDEMPLTEMAFKEALRLIPPVPSIPRCALRDTEFAGFRIPAGARVNVNPLFTHHMPEIWPEPARFDPIRFTGEATQARHKYAFVPYGGGAHMCLGLHFAYMQAKCFTYHLLTSARVRTAPDYKPGWQYWPIPKPRDGLPMTIIALY